MSAPTNDPPAGRAAVPADVIEDLLADDRRRDALCVLARRDDAVAVEDLAAAVRARELDCDVDAVDAGERRRIREEFFQRHLPKLTATGVVEYDSMLGTVAPGDAVAVEDVIDEG